MGRLLVPGLFFHHPLFVRVMQVVSYESAACFMSFTAMFLETMSPFLLTVSVALFILYHSIIYPDRYLECVSSDGAG